MSAARALGVIYLVMASVFGVAIALHQHPDLQRTATAASRSTWHLTANYIARPAAAVVSLRYADAHVLRPGIRYADAHILRPAAAVGLRQLKAFFDAIDPPIR